MKKRALFAIKLVITIGLSAWLVHGMLVREGIEPLEARLGSLQWSWIAIAVGLQMIAALAGIFRWRSILRAGGIDLPFVWLLRSFLIGRFIGALTPSTTGLDGWRIYEVSRATGATGRSAATIVVEKLVGLVGMSLVCALLVPFGGRELLGDRAIVIAIGIALASIAALIVARRPTLLSALASRLPMFLRSRATRIAEALGRVRLRALRFVQVLALGMLSHVALSAVFWATARALGLEVDAGALLVVGNAIVLAVLLPISIGGVGVREGVATALLITAAVTRTDAVLVALLGYLCGQVPALIGGLLLAGTPRVEREPHLTPAEQTIS